MESVKKLKLLQEKRGIFIIIAAFFLFLFIIFLLFENQRDDSPPKFTGNPKVEQLDVSQTVLLVTPRFVKRSGGNIILDNPHTTYIINVKDMGEWRLDYIEPNPKIIDLKIDTEYGVYTEIPQHLERVHPRTLVLKINTKTPLVFWVL